MRIITLSLLLVALPALAEHLPGGNITTRCISGNQHEITMKLWRECTGSPMIAQSLVFQNSCGVSFTLNNIPLVSVENVSPVCASSQGQTTCDGGTAIGIEEYTYRTTVFLSPCNYWRIYWSTCCRYPALNLQGSQGIFIEALLNNAGGACIELPTFAQNTPPLVCLNQPVSYDPGALFTPGQTLRFRLVEARRLLNPNPLDIQSVTYQAPFTGAEPYTGLAIDSLTGQITFTPLAQGYIVCVIEVRVYDSDGVWRGTIMRDFPFIAQVCDNAVPDVGSGVVTNVVGSGTAQGPYAPLACGPVCFDAVISDPDGDQVLTLSSNVTTAIPGANLTVTGTNPATATICFDASALSPGNYLFTITALDDACPVIGQQTYTYTLTIATSDVNAGDDASASICAGTVIDLSSLLSGDPGGTWSEGPVVNAAGVYTYTVSGACGDDVATFTITQDAPPSAGTDGLVTICAGTETDLSDQITGEAGGTWSDGAPLVSDAGTFTYTVSNACGSDVATIVVATVEPPDAGLSSAVAVCPQAAPFLMIDSLQGSPALGGTWTLGGAPHGPVFIPGSDGEGVFCYTVLGSLPCPSATACITVTLLDAQSPDCITLGVPALSNTLRFSPNPSSGQLMLSVQERSGLALLDASGRTVWSGTVNAGANSIDLPTTLTNGSYALRLQSADGSIATGRFELIR